MHLGMVRYVECFYGDLMKSLIRIVNIKNGCDITFIYYLHVNVFIKPTIKGEVYMNISACASLLNLYQFQPNPH